MKKILIGAVAVVLVVVLFLVFGGSKDTKTDDQIVLHNTISISRTYAALRIKTDNILMHASEYPDYETWNADMTTLLAQWQNVADKAALLEDQADAYSQEETAYIFVPTVYAYTKDEISNVFDKAPAGKKIKTLAKYLGVDAKRAYKILKSDQEFVKADAWNEAGDTFKKLETSAVVIKDGCKVAGYIGAAAMTGGAVGTAALGSAGVAGGLTAGTATAFEATVLVVTGTDLMLEVGEDAATIALGDTSKTVTSISNIRSYTDPAASLLSITDIPKNVAKGAEAIDKLGVVLVQVDQIRSMVQDGKLLGINIKPADTPAGAKVEAAPLKEDEIQDWIKDNQEDFELTEAAADSETDALPEVTLEGEDVYTSDLDEWLEGFENLDDWVDEADAEEAVSSEEEVNDAEDEEQQASEEENVETGPSGGSVVDAYMREMQGKEMNDLKIFLEYGNKFEELYAEGLITREEQDALMVEATRLNSGQAQRAMSIEDQERKLLDENEAKYVQINKERPSMDEIFKMSPEQREAIDEEQMQKQEARRAQLKEDCVRLHGEGEDAESCYYQGRF
jgi:hypothetical protein